MAKKQVVQERKLTERQAEFLAVFRALLDRSRGIPPTLAELAKELQVNKSTSASYVRLLIKKGYLKREPGKARSLQAA